jgi:hypothetical protein
MMPTRGTCAAVLFVAGLAFAAPVSSPGEAGGLRYQFKEGDKLQYLLIEKGGLEIDAGIGAQKIGSNSTFDVNWRVTRAGKDGKYTIIQTFQRIRVEADTPGGKAKYDSKDDKAPEDAVGKVMAEVFGLFSGAEMTLIVDTRGNIESLKFSDKLAKSLAKLPPQNAAAAASLSEDGLRRMVAQCLTVLPADGKTPARGVSWQSRLKAKFIAAVNFTLDNKSSQAGEVTRGGKKLLKIETRSTLAMSAEPGTPATIKVESQDAKSTSYFDRAAGRLAESTYSQQIAVEVQENGQTIKIKGKMETTLKQVEAKK